jgi:hypothetical protein
VFYSYAPENIQNSVRELIKLLKIVIARRMHLFKKEFLNADIN